MLVVIACLGACTAHQPDGETIPTLQPTTKVQLAIKTSNNNPSVEPSLLPIQTPTKLTSDPVEPTQLIAPSVTPSPRILPDLGLEGWKELPVIPEISQSVIGIYQQGLILGNNPHAFSKIGDCGSTPAWFLGDYDRDSRFYRLGEYQYLEGVIQAFQGSFSRTSLAAKAGFNVSSILSPIWADPKLCSPGETPLACEYRVHKPVIAIIMLGSNDVFHPKDFEPGMRQIIEYSISNGVIPILSTKADNEEGDGSLNATIAQLAIEYDVPLLNYWWALQGLPDNGLQEDGVHITWGPNNFSDPQNMKRGWPVRNLTSLQILDAVWNALNSNLPKP